MEASDCDNSGYMASNNFTYSYSGQSTFWVVSHNVDAVAQTDPQTGQPAFPSPTAFTNHCLTGPPGQSFPVNSPIGAEVFGGSHGYTGPIILPQYPKGAPEWYIGVEPQFTLDCNGDGKVNGQPNNPPPPGSDGYSFLSIGDDVRSGHPTASRIGYFYSSQPGQWVRTGVNAHYRIIGIGPQAGSAYYVLIAVSQGGGMPRGLQIYMGRRNHPGGNACFRWPFPNNRSMWQKRPSDFANVGGADWAFINAESLIPLGHIAGCNPTPDKGCLVNDGDLYNIQINLAGAFEYANNPKNDGKSLWKTPMLGPGTVKNISGVHWAVESNGPSFSGGVSRPTTY